MYLIELPKENKEEISRKVQEKLFSMGYIWNDGDKTFYNTKLNFIGMNIEKRTIFHDCSNRTSVKERHGLTDILAKDFLGEKPKKKSVWQKLFGA